MANMQRCVPIASYLTAFTQLWYLAWCAAVVASCAISPSALHTASAQVLMQSTLVYPLNLAVQPTVITHPCRPRCPLQVLEDMLSNCPIGMKPAGYPPMLTDLQRWIKDHQQTHESDEEWGAAQASHMRKIEQMAKVNSGMGADKI